MAGDALEICPETLGLSEATGHTRHPHRTEEAFITHRAQRVTQGKRDGDDPSRGNSVLSRHRLLV